MVKSGALPEDVEALLAFGLDLWSRLLATSYFATQKKLAYTCSLIMTVRQGLFPPPFSAHS